MPLQRKEKIDPNQNVCQLSDRFHMGDTEWFTAFLILLVCTHEMQAGRFKKSASHNFKNQMGAQWEVGFTFIHILHHRTIGEMSLSPHL